MGNLTSGYTTEEKWLPLFQQALTSNNSSARNLPSWVPPHDMWKAVRLRVAQVPRTALNSWIQRPFVSRGHVLRVLLHPSSYILSGVILLQELCLFLVIHHFPPGPFRIVWYKAFSSTGQLTTLDLFYELVTKFAYFLQSCSANPHFHPHMYLDCKDNLGTRSKVLSDEKLSPARVLIKFNVHAKSLESKRDCSCWLFCFSKVLQAE